MHPIANRFPQTNGTIFLVSRVDEPELKLSKPLLPVVPPFTVRSLDDSQTKCHGLYTSRSKASGTRMNSQPYISLCEST